MIPFVSIVMPSFNQARYIEAAVTSVLDQSWKPLELIIADGGSTDGTLEILAGLAGRDTRIHWFSEPDEGPAHALNKALNRCKGTIIGWLNSDDLYAPGAIERAVNVLETNPAWLMVYGHGEHVDALDRNIEPYPTKPPSVPVMDFAEGCFICQPTAFFRRTMHLLLGKFDQSLRTAFDFEYWLRAFGAFPERIGFVNALQARSRLHDACITKNMRKHVAVEGTRVLARHLGHAPRNWVLSYAHEILDPQKSRAWTPEELQAHLNTVVGEVRDCLNASELNLLQEELFEILRASFHQPAESPKAMCRFFDCKNL